MRIEAHRLRADEGEGFPFVASPNVGGPLEPKYLVIHFTAGESADSSVAWLTDEVARASAHLVIGRDGQIVQLVSFERVAWHAGESRWEGLSGLNNHSIGIELDNAGRLERKGGTWQAWFGLSYPETQVMEATHKHESAPGAWHIYTPEQIEATLHAAQTIVQSYGLKDVVGHDDISPGRKSDPGPAFPMATFRSRLFGRSLDEAPVFETTTALNIREGPGTWHEKLSLSPLPSGTRLDVVRESGSWRLVDVRGEVSGESDVQGWVHGNYIRRVG